MAIHKNTTVVPARRSTNLLKGPWEDSFHQLLSVVSEDLLLVAPFVKNRITRKISLVLAGRAVHLTLISNLRPESALNGASDLEGLAEAWQDPAQV